MDMARTVHRLTAVGVNRLKEAGIYSDGGNLNFRVAPGGSRSWVFRFAMNGKTRDAGLGPYPEVSLSEARVKAFEWRKLRSLALIRLRNAMPNELPTLLRHRSP